MDVSAAAGIVTLMKASQTKQAIGISLLKMAVDQQNLMAAILEQGAQQATQIAVQSAYGFSVYA